MKKLLAILLTVGIIWGTFVGCGDKNEQLKEIQKQEQFSEENKQDNTIDLMDSDEYKKMDKIMPFEILKIYENTDESYKSLTIEVGVKESEIREEIKEFKTNASAIAAYIDTQCKDKGYRMLIVLNKQVGGVTTYRPKDELDNYMISDGASFGDSNNQKIYDGLNEK